jgi:transcriptional regulator GlxA family with amidase domain
MTKTGAKSATSSKEQIEVGLACDANTSQAGIYGLTDLFKYANEFAAKRERQIGKPPVRITHWRSDEVNDDVTCAFDSCPGSPHVLTAVIVPGNERATIEPVKDGPMITWLRRQHQEGVVLAGVCGGVFILAKTGLLAGRQATTHWALSDQFVAQFPDVLLESDHMVIDYGDIVAAGGVLAWADLGLRLVERLLGPTIMGETARYMLVDPPGREQRFYSDFTPTFKHGDEAIVKAQLLLSSHRERPTSVADLARHSKLEPRTFLRRFTRATGMKPREYQQRLQVSRAREMLEFSGRGIDEIASRVGYIDIVAFRRVFRKIVGLTPSDFRRRFSRPNRVQGGLADGKFTGSCQRAPLKNDKASLSAHGCAISNCSAAITKLGCHAGRSSGLCDGKRHSHVLTRLTLGKFRECRLRRPSSRCIFSGRR